MKSQNRELAYRTYITDALKLRYGLNKRWIDMMRDNEKPEDNRTADDIISRIASNSNVTMIEKQEKEVSEE